MTGRAGSGGAGGCCSPVGSGASAAPLLVPGAAPEGPGGSGAPGGRGGTLRSRGFDSSDWVLCSPAQREGTRHSKLACPGLILLRAASGVHGRLPSRSAAPQRPSAHGKLPSAAGLRWVAAGSGATLGWLGLPTCSSPGRTCPPELRKGALPGRGKFQFVPFPVT